MVEIVDVHKRFGTFTAVDGVSLSIGAGEFVTLLGPSGCGKTTLLRMLGGFETPDRGAIRLDGRDVTADPPYRRDVNQVFQSYALFPHLSVERNIAFGLRIRRLPRATIRAKVADAIEAVSLTGMAARMPSELSGGQRQRVALARALVCEPRVLLLDEPLSALDAKLRRSMQLELKRLQAKLGITFVFVTHDQEEALTMSDRVAVMNAGRVEQVGPAADVYHRPATAFVATFVGQTNLLPATVVGPGRVRLSDGSELGCADVAAATATGAGEVLLSIRPERVALHVDPPGIPGAVVERAFRGSVEQYAVRTDGGLQLTAVTTGGGLPGRVHCRIEPAAVAVVRPA